MTQQSAQQYIFYHHLAGVFSKYPADTDDANIKQLLENTTAATRETVVSWLNIAIYATVGVPQRNIVNHASLGDSAPRDLSIPSLRVIMALAAQGCPIATNVLDYSIHHRNLTSIHATPLDLLALRYIETPIREGFSLDVRRASGIHAFISECFSIPWYRAYLRSSPLDQLHLKGLHLPAYLTKEDITEIPEQLLVYFFLDHSVFNPYILKYHRPAPLSPLYAAKLAALGSRPLTKWVLANIAPPLIGPSPSLATR